MEGCEKTWRYMEKCLFVFSDLVKSWKEADLWYFAYVVGTPRMRCHARCLSFPLSHARSLPSFPFHSFTLLCPIEPIIRTIKCIMASSPYQDCSFIAGTHVLIDLARSSQLGNILTAIDFTCLLQTTISTSTLRQPVLPHDVVQQLDHHLMLDPLTTVVRDGMDPKRLDAIGTSLWNTCTQMLAVRDKPDDIQALAKSRYVAFVILNLAVPPTMFGLLRSLGASLTAAQTCIGKWHTGIIRPTYDLNVSNAYTVAKQLDAAYKILGVSGDRLHAVQPSHLGLDLTLNYTLTTKYWLLRIRLVRPHPLRYTF